MSRVDPLSDPALVVAARQETFTYADIENAFALDRRRVRRIIQAWISAGLAEERGQGIQHAALFALTAAGRGGVMPVSDGLSVSERLWNGMRGLKSGFTPTVLAAHCAMPVSREEASAYCRLLFEAGYLAVIEKAVPGRSDAVYRLVRPTGPMAPVRRMVPAVHDPNTGETAMVGRPG